MKYYIEKENKKEKLYDKRVTRFLLKYILKYKRYLFISFFLVIIITGISLLVPYVSKIIIDRYIIKEGNIIYINNIKKDLSKSTLLLKKLKSSKKLDNNKYFLFKDKLKYFSKKEILDFKSQNIFSKEKYLIIENPNIANNSLNSKINNLLKNKKVFKFNENIYLINSKCINLFTLNETLNLRQNDFIMIFYIFIIMLSI